MEFEFRNLGALDRADFELKDLTLICGKNNTGKTYLTYALYGFLEYGRHLFDIEFPDEAWQALKTNGFIEIDLEELYIKKFDDFLKKATSRYPEKLVEILTIREENLKKFEIKCELNIPNNIHREYYKKIYTSGQNKNTIIFSKLENSFYLTIKETEVLDKPRGEFFFPKEIINNVIKDIIGRKVFPRPFIASAERTGAIMFRNELNLNRTRMLDYLHRKEKKEAISINDLFHIYIEKTIYPAPVTENVDLINQLNQFETKTSFISKDYPELIEEFTNMVGGIYQSSKEGDMQFITKKGKQKLNMSQSSSSVRSLVIIGHYLKHIAQPGDLLIIDEPELNLHPENQRKFARLISGIIKTGTKVFITTHSDYFVKELNTLIMLNNKTGETQAIKEKYHYHDLELLSIDKVNLYMIDYDFLTSEKGGKRRVKGNILKRADIDPIYGIEAKTFDETINQMNKIQSELLDVLS